MSGVPADVRPASVAVKDAADVLMVRWTAGNIGGSEADDAQLLRHLYALDKLAEDLEEIEARRERATGAAFVSGTTALERHISAVERVVGRLKAIRDTRGR